MEQQQKLVLITGISGYLGSHICNEFLNDGTYKVRGTVRDKQNEKKIGPLREAFRNFDKMELVEMDLLNERSIMKAVEGCNYIVHIASPFPPKPPSNEQEVIKPALEGTLSVMKAAHLNKVKRVVITSSIAAIIDFKQIKDVYTEEDWAMEEGSKPYEKSKILAERAAWKFVEDLPAEDKFELVVINPSLVLGPNIVLTDFSSGLVISKLLLGAFHGAPAVKIAIVDVRECAIAHLQAIKVPEAANQRFLISNREVWFKEIAEILKKEFGIHYKFSTKEISYCTVRIASCCQKSLKLILHMWKKEYRIDNQKSINVLGIQYRTAEETILEMAHSMIQQGLIPDKRKQ